MLLSPAHAHPLPARRRAPRPQHVAAPPRRAAAAELSQAIAVLQAFGARTGAELGEREADALSALYRTFADTLLAVARRLTGSADDAQDVVHDVFVRLPQALQRYQPGNFAGWLRRVTARTALMSVRGRTHRREARLDDADAAWEPIAPDDFDALGDAAALRRAVDALREPYRQVVVLRIYADMSHHEIAELLGITPNVSEVRLCRAIKQLRTLLTTAAAGTALRPTGT